MESRLERHRKSKPQRQQGEFREKTPVKVFLSLTLAAAACFAVGVGAAYVTSRTDPAVQLEAASSSEPRSASSTTPASQAGTSGTVSPEPSVNSSAVTPASSKASSENSASAAGDGTVKLDFVGDVIMAGNVEDILLKQGYDYPYTNVKDIWTNADYTIANLETPVTTRGTAQSKEYVYRSSPDALPELKAAGVDLVNLANNHIMDYGQDGLFDTMEVLDKLDIKRVGAGKNTQEAYEPVIVEKQGIKIAFLGFSRVVPDASWKAGADHAGVAETYSYLMPVEAVQKAKQQADLVVVLAHWGTEREDNPDKNQKELAHRYIDAGADLIVGGHPHVLQGFENYKGKWIAYSMGNFIFTTNGNSKTWDSGILEASCSKDQQCDIQLVPILTKGALPTPMNAEDGSKLFERLTKISKAFNVKVDEQGHILQTK
ncbi:CapA family protein [Paenibacillus hexagrammi]|uniref:CapA family protein n=1 Tax=Paenibacillus hexagrammi TaxID=2908839 RepID=A0ABY3SCG0_9BACL|nr:CapA family protein [Paenibacillus sp. YPD9-1]UJF31631.1 CapA family protein [Paenibacillus sp. YPD9-1]